MGRKIKFPNGGDVGETKKKEREKNPDIHYSIVGWKGECLEIGLIGVESTYCTSGEMIFR